MKRGAALAVAALVGVVAPRSVRAQRALTGSAFVSLAEHRVQAGFGVERVSGGLLGLKASLRVRSQVNVAVRVEGGSLKASDSGVFDRDVGEIGVDARVSAARWLELQTGVARRVYSTVLARQAWTLVAAGAGVRLGLVGDAVHGLASASWLPVTSVSGLPRPDLAFRAATGLEYSRAGLTFGLAYSLERYDFPAQGTVRRLEQLSALTFQLDVGGRR